MAFKTSYDASADEMLELFADYVEGDANRPAIALSARPLDAAARNAIEKSLQAFGYAEKACTYVTLFSRDSTIEGAGIALDARALFVLIEALDPVSPVHPAQYIEPDAAVRVFGRTTASFANLSLLLDTGDGRQHAWRIFKSFRK